MAMTLATAPQVEAPAPAATAPNLPRRPRNGLARSLVRRAAQRWPAIRRDLPRDLVVFVWLILLFNSFGLAWVMTDSVHTSAALVIKGARVQPGQLAVFAYSGQTLPTYYSQDAGFRVRQWLGQNPTLAGPTKGEGFVKFLIGVAGDRIEVIDDRVFLNTRRGRLDMGRCKPVSRAGVPLTPITSQVIPDGMAYMWAPHVDALDSRYAVMGLVPVSSIVGRGVKLW
jgi:conjugal transfer pilin signal peptidase TrbI